MKGRHGLRASNTTGGSAMVILESDLRAFAEELNVFVDWNYLDEKTEESPSTRDPSTQTQ